MKLLHVDSSILGENSVSRTISAAATAHLASTIPGLEITDRDLAAAPLTHLSGAYLGGQGPDVQIGVEILQEFIAADIVVIGCPMYNFAIPSQLKVWIDRICVAGKTFKYTEKGAEGLLGGKRVIVAISRGGLYGPETPQAAFEHQESYLRALFTFLGITDITFIRAEGIAYGPEQREAALKAAVHQAETLQAA